MKLDSELGVALGSAVPFKVGDKEIMLSPLTLADWGQLDRTALQLYKDELIDTYIRNAEKLPEKMRNDELAKAFRRASELTATELPQQKVRTYYRDKEGTIVTDEDGKPVEISVNVEYVRWWLTTKDGQRYAIWLSARHAMPECTLADIDKAFSDSGKAMLNTAANRVAELSEPQLKN